MLGTPVFLASLLLIHSALFAWQNATHTPMVDFFIFWCVPHSLSIKPATDIYTEQGRRDMGAEMARRKRHRLRRLNVKPPMRICRIRCITAR